MLDTKLVQVFALLELVFLLVQKLVTKAGWMGLTLKNAVPLIGRIVAYVCARLAGSIAC